MIIVSSLAAAQTLVTGHGVERVVSLLGPDTPHRGFEGVRPANHLKLTFHDIVAHTPGFVPPRYQDTQRLIGFLEDWDRRAPMLIHCWAGISRSTAAAYTALCLLQPSRDEEELAWELREASPSATPNRLIVAQADDALNRGGRMVHAVEEIGRGADAFEGVPFSLNLPSVVRT